MSEKNKGEINLVMSITLIVAALVIFLAVCVIIKNVQINNNVNTPNISGDSIHNGDSGNFNEELQSGTFAKPSIAGEYTYNGRLQTVSLKGYDSQAMNTSNTTRKNAGTQEVVVALKNSKLEWEDKTTEPVKLEWTISKAKLTLDWTNLTIRYDGESHLPVATANGLGSDKLTVKVSGASSEAGEHTATAELQGSAADNYEVTNPSIQYNIVKESGDIGEDDDGITLSRYTYYYNGSANEPSVRITIGNKKLEEGKDFTVRYENNVNVGTAKVIIIGNGKEYKGRITKEFQILRSPKASVTVEDKIYNGNDQTGIFGKNVELFGDSTARKVGTYKVIAAPLAGYAWEDGTFAKVELEWSIKEGIKVGDYVAYSPQEKLSSKLTAESKAWRIFSIGDGTVLITPYGAVNQSEVMLTGSDGYVNAIDNLNKLCEDAYSNSNKGLKARSMTIEDLNNACQFTVPVPSLRYAYYLATDTGNITQNGKTYIKTKHSSALYSITEPRFYTYDLQTNDATTTSSTPKKLKADEPILMTQTYYTYNPNNSVSVKNPTAGALLGSGNGWLASRCVRLEATNANFCVYYANADEVGSNYLCNSSGYQYSPTSGLHPVVEIKTSKLDIDNANSNGTSASPWNIK